MVYINIRAKYTTLRSLTKPCVCTLHPHSWAWDNQIKTSCVTSITYFVQAFQNIPALLVIENNFKDQCVFRKLRDSKGAKNCCSKNKFKAIQPLATIIFNVIADESFRICYRYYYRITGEFVGIYLYLLHSLITCTNLDQPNSILWIGFQYAPNHF